MVVVVVVVVVHHDADEDYGDSWQSVVGQHFDTGDGGRNVVGGA